MKTGFDRSPIARTFRYRVRWRLVLVLGLAPWLSVAQHKMPGELYRYGSPSADGIGKVYLGREIAAVQGFSGASWLDRPERNAEEHSLLAISYLRLHSNAIVADIGAGTGHYSFQLAKKVPLGKVIFVEVENQYILAMKEKVKSGRVTNLEIVKGDALSPNVPHHSLDIALMVDVYHELSYPQQMLSSIHESLKPGGQLVLLEFRAEDVEVPIKRIHKMSLRQIDKELTANGFVLIRKEERLPWQHMVFYGLAPAAKKPEHK